MNKQEIAKLKILTELVSNSRVTQRDLSKLTDISLSYLNGYIKQLIQRELILVKKMDGKRLLYNLTPKGMLEKVRMTTEYAKQSIKHYSRLREKVIHLCSELEQNRLTRIVICGISEPAEIVYIATIECGLEIIKVVDDNQNNKIWLKKKIYSIKSLKNENDLFDSVIISDIERCYELAEKLHEAEVPYGKMVVCTGQKIKPVTMVQIVD